MGRMTWKCQVNPSNTHLYPPGPRERACALWEGGRGCPAWHLTSVFCPRYWAPAIMQVGPRRAGSNSILTMALESQYCYAFLWGFSSCSAGGESAGQCRKCKRCGFSSWVGKIPWERKWQATPIFLPGESCGQRSLAGYSPWGCKESETTELTCISMWRIRLWEPTL